MSQSSLAIFILDFTPLRSAGCHFDHWKYFWIDPISKIHQNSKIHQKASKSQNRQQKMSFDKPKNHEKYLFIFHVYELFSIDSSLFWVSLSNMKLEMENSFCLLVPKILRKELSNRAVLSDKA